jgi:cell division protein FtsB
VRILVEETKSPKSADELLKAYAGREADLLKNLRKMKALQDKNDAIRAEVADLVEATKSPRSADELLKAYAGREADLLKNLRKMKALQDKNNAIRAEVADLCQKVNSPKTPDELLESYKGREDELLKNLRRLSFKQQVRFGAFLSWSTQLSSLPKMICYLSLLKRRRQCAPILLPLSRNWKSPRVQMSY